MTAAATVEVLSGEKVGDRVAVAAGTTVKVGRTRPADLLIPDDPLLSGVHFAVACGPDGCRVTDLGSRFGTFRRGERVADAALRDGDEILAGRTRFAVSVTGGPATTAAEEPPALAAPPPISSTTPLPTVLSPGRTGVRDWLGGLDEPLFAILDAAREPTIPERLAKAGEDHLSLFDGEQGKELAPFGPWLVRLSGRSKLLDELVAEGWGNSWGVYLTCGLPLAEVRRHLRRFLMVKLPDGRKVFFRFYDPRVLRPYLPTCTADEAKAFLGPVGGYYAEAADGMGLVEYAAGTGRWRAAHAAAL